MRTRMCVWHRGTVSGQSADGQHAVGGQTAGSVRHHRQWQAGSQQAVVDSERQVVTDSHKYHSTWYEVTLNLVLSDTQLGTKDNSGR
jgi:hypothetical protein